MRKILGAAALASMILLTACNTISGVGKDVRSAGDSVSDAAEGAK